PYVSIRQRFESNADEGLYGTGLHQQGWMNLKGRDVELLQHNIDNAIPYLTSSRNYGILWDNNSITRYGDPRGLRQIGDVVTLYDKDGVEGALTATYSIDGEVKLVRREEKIDYQFISGLEDFPDERSEEHTSELQSRENLVCRLLLEKKNYLDAGPTAV